MIRTWFKTLFRIVHNYDKNYALLNQQLYSTARQIEALETILKDRTDIHLEAPYFRGPPSTVIVCGRYKNQDFVEVFQTVPQDFITVVDMLKQMSRYAKLCTVDGPIELKAWLRKEL